MNINILCGKNTVEVLCMTEKAGLEKTVVFNLKSANESDVNNIVNEKGHESRSFYYNSAYSIFLTLLTGFAQRHLSAADILLRQIPLCSLCLKTFG